MWNSHETPRGTVQSHPACKTAEIIGRRCVYIHLVWNQDILQEEITKKVKLKESVFKGIFQHLQKYAHSLSRRELVTRQLHIQTVPSLSLSSPCPLFSPLAFQRPLFLSPGCRYLIQIFGSGDSAPPLPRLPLPCVQCCPRRSLPLCICFFCPTCEWGATALPLEFVSTLDRSSCGNTGKPSSWIHIGLFTLWTSVGLPEISPITEGEFVAIRVLLPPDVMYPEW